MEYSALSELKHPYSRFGGGIRDESARVNMGRGHTRKITVNGSVTNHLRYIYRGYLQIAAINAVSGVFQWFIRWESVRQIPRGLGGGLAKCKAFAPERRGRNGVRPRQVFSSGGTILTAYTYSPYGCVTANGNVTQPIQWSSEYNDSELGLVYYNYRHYNPADGRWIGRDLTGEDGGLGVYGFANNAPVDTLDVLVDSAKRKHNLPGKNNRQSSQLKQVDYRIDDFGRSCDKKSMKEVVRYTLKPLTKGHLVGHSFIYCPSVGYRGKYPAGNGFLSAGEIRDDKSLYKQYKGTDRLVKVRSYQACPQTLKVMAKHIESSDEIYVLAQAQCENWVLNLIEISKTESYRRMSDKDPVKGALFQFPGGEWPKAKELDEKERRSIGILSTHWTF